MIGEGRATIRLFFEIDGLTWIGLDWIGLLLLLYPYLFTEILFLYYTFTVRLDILYTCHREGFRNFASEILLYLDFIAYLYSTYIIPYISFYIFFIGII